MYTNVRFYLITRVFTVRMHLNLTEGIMQKTYILTCTSLTQLFTFHLIKTRTRGTFARFTAYV